MYFIVLYFAIVGMTVGAISPRGYGPVPSRSTPSATVSSTASSTQSSTASSTVSFTSSAIPSFTRSSTVPSTSTGCRVYGGCATLPVCPTTTTVVTPSVTPYCSLVPVGSGCAFSCVNKYPTIVSCIEVVQCKLYNVDVKTGGPARCKRRSTTGMPCTKQFCCAV